MRLLFVDLSVEPAKQRGLGLGHLLGTFSRLPRKGVRQADLHVDDDPLQLLLVEVTKQRGWRLWISDQILPDLNAHPGAIYPPPTKEYSPGLCALMFELSRQHRERLLAGLTQNMTHRYLDQIPPDLLTAFPQQVQIPLTLKRL